MKRFFLLILLLSGVIFSSQAQNTKNNDTRVILITLDGFRWQELFGGADEQLVTNKKYVHDTTALKNKFWKNTAEERRETLLPFIWSHVAREGQIHGNRTKGSNVNVTNTMWFSYPGYNEILSGKADDENITSNDKIYNPNQTILELANNNGYNGKVAAFGSWDVFPYIVNDQRSGIPVNAGFKTAPGKNLTQIEQFLNRIQPNTPSPWGSVRLDIFTHNYAIEYMKREQPSLVYISYGETDDFAHDGNYEAYLNSAHSTDAFIKELWDFTQSNDFYKNKTVFMITTDHGRGTDPLDSWRSHGGNVKGADQVWFICFGKDVKATGEVNTEEQLYSNQHAATIGRLLGLKMTETSKMGKALDLQK